MKLGVLVHLGADVESSFRAVAELGIETVQLACWEPEAYTQDNAAIVHEAARVTNIGISAVWCGWTGPRTWDLADGPSTLGLVPIAYRARRMDEIIAGARFAKSIGVRHIITHVGFIPEDPGDAAYPGLVTALKYLVDRISEFGCSLLFETGQETPVALLRTLEDLGRPNVGVNLDTANLILYGKGNPVDAVEVLGSWIRAVHVKDGLYPRSGRELGEEVPLGVGKVDIGAVVRGLLERGYDGPLTIEREVSGPGQRADIEVARDLLRTLVAGDGRT
jgi:L-ribulose-5-phosphate 3-epimerase